MVLLIKHGASGLQIAGGNKVINTPTEIGAFVCYNKKESKSLTMENKPICSRNIYCADCAKKKHPYKGQDFLVFGGTSQKFFAGKADRNQKKGMTPHLIFMGKKEKHFVEIHAYCGMHNCGVEIGDEVYIFPERKKITKLPIKDYNALIIKWKQTGFEI